MDSFIGDSARANGSEGKVNLFQTRGKLFQYHSWGSNTNELCCNDIKYML